LPLFDRVFRLRANERDLRDGELAEFGQGAVFINFECVCGCRQSDSLVDIVVETSQLESQVFMDNRHEHMLQRIEGGMACVSIALKRVNAIIDSMATILAEQRIHGITSNGAETGESSSLGLKGSRRRFSIKFHDLNRSVF
jgi:hypothetical protein